MKIAFWSNVHGQAGITSNAIAISILSAIEKHTVALLQSHFTLNNLSLPLLGLDIIPESFRDSGIDALIRDIKSKPLSKDTVVTDAISVPGLNRRYNLYVGTGKMNEKDYEREMINMQEPIYNSLAEFHDYVFVDVRSGYRDLSKQILDTSNLVVVCLDQNTHVIDRYFENPIEADNICYIIGNYDKDSKYNLRNLIKKYPQLKKKTAVIAHNSEFMDSQNDGTTVQFMLKNYNCKAESSNYEFMQSVYSCMKLLGIKERG